MLDGFILFAVFMFTGIFGAITFYQWRKLRGIETLNRPNNRKHNK